MFDNWNIFHCFPVFSSIFQYYSLFPVFTRSQVDSLVDDYMFENWDDGDFGFYDTDSDEEAGTKVCSAQDYLCFFCKRKVSSQTICCLLLNCLSYKTQNTNKRYHLCI